ncbi:9413_t:CDS:2, partial [Acaulospora colombiana]
MEDGDIEILYNQRVKGSNFFDFTATDFERWGIPGGPAKEIEKLINKIQGAQPVAAGTSKSNTGLVSVFADNSNLFIEGKYTIGQIEKAGTFDQQRNSFYLNQLHIDHGRLLSTILKGRQMGSNPIIVGSRPPPNDSLWKQIRNQGYDVVVYDRNIENKEKKVDMALGVSAMNVIWSNDLGVLVLIAGDGDYEPVINEALKRKWKVEIWFWSSGISGDLMRKSIFYSLDNFYRHFTYAYGQDPIGKNYTLEITDGETIGKWGDDEVMNCFVPLKLYGWWYRKERHIISLYFDNKANLEKAKNWVEIEYPDIQVWEVEK